MNARLLRMNVLAGAAAALVGVTTMAGCGSEPASPGATHYRDTTVHADIGTFVNLSSAGSGWYQIRTTEKTERFRLANVAILESVTIPKGAPVDETVGYFGASWVQDGHETGVLLIKDSGQ